MSSKFEKLMEIAVEVHNHKRGSGGKPIDVIVARPNGNKGVKVLVPGSKLEELDLEKGCKMSLILLPNGNWVLGRTRTGSILSKVTEDSKAYYCAISTVRLRDGIKEKVADINDGLIVFPPETFVSLEK